MPLQSVWPKNLHKTRTSCAFHQKCTGCILFRKPAYTLVLAIILAFNIVEIYLFAKVIHAIFRKNLSAAFYV